jgi:site-specific DNA recombinase
MKVALYCRVSTDKQDADKQEDYLREWAQRNKHDIYKVYKDVISGSTSSRPEFNELLKEMRDRKFNMIAVTKLDRLGRSLQHLLSLFEEFNKRGVHFSAITQNIDTSSAAGKLQLQIMGAFAEFERNIISERTKEALKGNKKVGKRGKDRKPRKRGGIKKKLYYIN